MDYNNYATGFFEPSERIMHENIGKDAEALERSDERISISAAAPFTSCGL